MRFRIFTYLAVTAGLIGGIALLADALTVSDEERIECLIDAVTEDPQSIPMEWTDPGRERVSVQSRGRAIEADDWDEIGDPLADFTGDEVEVVQRSVRVEGDRASAAVRARVDGRLRNARFRLVRDVERGWLVTSIVTG